MDPDRPAAPPRPGSSPTRRRALRLLAGGALGGLIGPALAAPAEGALTERAGFSPGWTHLAGTTTGLLFYQRGSGRGASGTCVDGNFVQKAEYADFTPDWNDVVGAGRALFFHRWSDGRAASGYLNASGAWVFPPGAVYDLGPGWGVFPGTRSGRFAWYGGDHLAPQRLSAAGRLTASFLLVFSAGFGWTHLAGTGFDAYLLYRSDTGQGATGRVEARPTGETTSFRWVPLTRPRFAAGWTHVVGTYNGGLLCYDEATGRGLSGDLDEFGNWTRAADLALGAGWTHVVGAGARSVLFYNTNSGKGIGGFLTAAGAWTKTTRYG